MKRKWIVFSVLAVALFLVSCAKPNVRYSGPNVQPAGLFALGVSMNATMAETEALMCDAAIREGFSFTLTAEGLKVKVDATGSSIQPERLNAGNTLKLHEFFYLFQIPASPSEKARLRDGDVVLSGIMKLDKPEPFLNRMLAQSMAEFYAKTRGDRSGNVYLTGLSAVKQQKTLEIRFTAVLRENP